MKLIEKYKNFNMKAKFRVAVAMKVTQRTKELDYDDLT